MSTALRPDAPAWHPGQVERLPRNAIAPQLNQHAAQDPSVAPYHYHPVHGFYTAQVPQHDQTVYYHYTIPLPYHSYQAVSSQWYPEPSGSAPIDPQDPFVKQMRQVEHMRSSITNGHGTRGPRRGKKKTQTGRSKTDEWKGKDINGRPGVRDHENVTVAEKVQEGQKGWGRVRGWNRENGENVDNGQKRGKMQNAEKRIDEGKKGNQEERGEEEMEGGDAQKLS
jgi:hypothetical protein